MKARAAVEAKAAPEGAGAAAEAQVAAARARRDEWLREVIDWHLSPETGTPFWIERAKGLGWDPRREIRTFADLARFEPFRDEWLRGGPLERWIPRGLAGERVYVFETGGSTGGATGAPERRIDAADLRTDIETFSKTLPDGWFPRGSDWLAIAPTGPRRLRLALEGLAQVRGGIAFLLDLDPRWLVKVSKRGWREVHDAYRTHVIDQALTLLKAHPNIHCLLTTPKLLDALCDKISLRQAGITGVVCGGAPITADFHRRAREELLEGAELVPVYWSTFMGLACRKPFVPEDGHAVTYYPPEPRAVLQVVDPDHPGREVGYGERGRVKLTTLTKELFLPGLLERDEAARAAPIQMFPWDGVRDVRPFARLPGSAFEGLY
jgi:hypothetical protein